MKHSCYNMFDIFKINITISVHGIKFCAFRHKAILSLEGLSKKSNLHGVLLETGYENCFACHNFP